MQATWLIQRGALCAFPIMATRLSGGPRYASALYRVIRKAVLGVDRLLRRYYSVREFTDDPACLLRVAPGRAAAALHLPDGTDLASGDPILVLHLWNEQLPRYFGGGGGLGWAAQFRAALDRSLRLLAMEAATDPALAQVRALRADTAFVTRGRGRKLARIAAQFGFVAPLAEAVGSPRPRWRLGDDLVVFGLTFACNPPSLRGKALRRDRYELWISRERLLARYWTGGAVYGPIPAALPPDRKAAA